MSNRFVFTDEIEVEEQSIRYLSIPFEDAEGNPPPAGVFSAATATYIEQVTGDVINDREAQDVWNVNGGSWDEETGLFRFRLDVEDTTITNSAIPPGLNQVNELVITFVGSESGNDYQEQAHIRIIIRNRRLIPQEIEED